MLESILWAIAGGGLIGLAASWLLLAKGRVAGISGILGGVLGGADEQTGWRLSFLAGLLVGGGITLLKICSPAASNKERIPCEGVRLPIGLHNIGETTIGMAGRGPDFESVLPESNHVAMNQCAVCTSDVGDAGNTAQRTGQPPQLTGPRHVVGVNMRVQYVDKFEPEFVDQFKVAVDLLEYRIDHHSLAGVCVRQ